jgi:hypothetical protein
MARHLRDAAQSAGDTLPANTALINMIRRWERGAGVSERYRLYYCQVLGITAEQFGSDQPCQPPQAPAGTAATAVTADLAAGTRTPHTAVVLARPDMRSEPFVAYRGSQDTGSPGSWTTREVLMAAHESSEHAERAEHREIGEATLEQLRADVVRLSRDYMHGEPLPLFMEMRRVRNRLHAALDRHLWPRDQSDLYFLLGCLNGLMSCAARDLGSRQAAEELARAGWAYAVVIEHRPLQARLRSELADVAYWDSQLRQSRDLALSGLQYLPDGLNGALLHLANARASAALGDSDSARRAINAADEARDRGHSDDVLEMGGEFGFSRASQHYYAGSVFVEIPRGEADAIAELESAIDLYAAGPEPGEDHSDHYRMAARIDLATADLKAGRLDAAVAAADPVFVLPPSRRVTSLPQCFSRVRIELAQPIYQGSAQAREFDERIEQFCRETIVADLQSLSGGSA